MNQTKLDVRMTVTLKPRGKPSQGCWTDPTPFILVLEQETPDSWIGKPVSWYDRGVQAGRHLSFPKFAWEEVAQ